MSNELNPVKYSFTGKNMDCYFDADFEMIEEIVPKEKTIFITDENIYKWHGDKFSGKKVIVIKAGEQYKNQQTVDTVIDQLIKLQADRETFIAGVGGGVVTDVTGFVASVYMRGIKFGFVPTSILAMVDAAIGGKNGIDAGVYKNLVGVIRHPEFLLFDYTFLETLPDDEWINGFAEIIKHACIKDEKMFGFLEQNSLMKFQSSVDLVGDLIRQNADIKYDVVSKDEFETGDRKLLNFGHTIGHAIENVSNLSHGHAVSIGMVAACRISETMSKLATTDTQRVMQLLEKYELPVAFNFDKRRAWEVLQLDKKKAGNDMNFVVLDHIGKASVQRIKMDDLHEIFNEIV
ncbi:MAG: 3-dehydroquinate synthase [Bacteroidota bacterium]|nr:3-dehydroquinate synthase [Bacteroidota bacterium]